MSTSGANNRFLAAAAGIGLVCGLAIALVWLGPQQNSTIRLMLFPSELAVSDGPPADHNSILFGAVWDREVAHDEAPPVNCLSGEASGKSQCLAVLPVNAPPGATHAMLKIKAKAWVMSGPGEAWGNYSLLYASTPVDGSVANHFIHVETWGGGPEGKDERRRVVYANALVPIVDDSVTLAVGKQVNGKSQVEIAVYLGGYVMASGPTEVVADLIPAKIR